MENLGVVVVLVVVVLRYLQHLGISTGSYNNNRRRNYLGGARSGVGVVYQLN